MMKVFLPFIYLLLSVLLILGVRNLFKTNTCLGTNGKNKSLIWIYIHLMQDYKHPSCMVFCFITKQTVIRHFHKAKKSIFRLCYHLVTTTLWRKLSWTGENLNMQQTLYTCYLYLQVINEPVDKSYLTYASKPQILGHNIHKCRESGKIKDRKWIQLIHGLFTIHRTSEKGMADDN